MAGETYKRSGSFFDDVYDVVRLIPYGRVTSYGAIAEYLGSRGSARMVGWAMNSSHLVRAGHALPVRGDGACPVPAAPAVPAHRVVNRIGMLTGKHHFGGPTLMQQLLENEGVRIVDDRVADFDTLFWDPSKEL